MKKCGIGKQWSWLLVKITFGRQLWLSVASPPNKRVQSDRYKLGFTARGLVYPDGISGGG